METKNLKIASLSECSTHALMGFICILPIIRMGQWLCGAIGVTITVTGAGIALGFVIAIANAFVAEFPLTGIGIAVEESLGTTLAMSIFF